MWMSLFTIKMMIEADKNQYVGIIYSSRLWENYANQNSLLHRPLLDARRV